MPCNPSAASITSRLPEAQSILDESGGYDMRSAPERTQQGAAAADRRSGDGARAAQTRVEEDEYVDETLARGTIKVDKRGRATPPNPR